MPGPFAHSKENDSLENWQTLDEHLQNVADGAANFASAFNSKEWGRNAGWLHDIGKATDGFQKYLFDCNGIDDPTYDEVKEGRGNHSTAGAVFAEQKWGKCTGRILSYLIAGHHAGLPDWFAYETGGASLSQRLNSSFAEKASWAPYLEVVEPNLLALPLPPFIGPQNIHFWARMVFSCLVDADFLDTEAFMQGQISRGQFPSVASLANRFFSYVDRKQTDARDTLVNRLRSQIRDACETAAEMNSGLFSLTVPTGGGKTLSSMAFALKHALKHHKDRIIYVIPYTSIIEQTARQFAEIFGEENVIEHHSNLDPEKETQRTRMASENWDAPIVVTTNVQFFESFFAAKPSSCRKLHNVANSVVILDEAQLIPPQWLRPCVHVIQELTNNYSTSLVLCTATQPALPGLNPIEIIPESLNLYQQLERVDYQLPKTLERRQSWEEIADALQQHKQVLCIVNSRRDCFDLHKLMPEGTFYLSGTLCGEHRSELIAEIKGRLMSHQPIRVISTQLVEAGVDIDFPVVFRAWTGIDSIAQAGGRCNREGRITERGKVVVFLPPKVSPRGLLQKAETTTTELHASQDIDLHSPCLYNEFFSLFYGRLNEDGSRWLSDKFVKDVTNKEINIQFRTAAKEFMIIDKGAQRSVVVRFKGSEHLIDKLRKQGPKRETMRRLQRYTINIPTACAEAMLGDGRIEEIQWKNQKTGILVNCMLKYDNLYGLNIWDAFDNPEDYIC